MQLVADPDWGATTAEKANSHVSCEMFACYDSKCPCEVRVQQRLNAARVA